MSSTVESTSPARSRRILVVEDDAVNRTFLRLSLEKWGYHVLLVQSVKVAQDEFNLHGPDHFDCVICDYWLPDQTGLDFLRWLKDEDTSLAAVILTADGERKLITESLRLGAVDFLEKPVNLQKLQLAVEKAVTQTTRQRHLAQSETAMEDLGRTQRWMVRAVEQQSIRLFFHPKFEAGGDFLAHFQIDSDSSCCLLTDVSGHDPQAAYISAYFHGIFRGMTLRAAPMTAVFSYFNDFLVNQWNQADKLRSSGANSTSVAAAALLIDSRCQTASLLNCGAPMPVHVLPDGRAHFMGELGGPPLGWFSDMDIQASIHSMTGGGTVYMWTDGLSDLAESQSVQSLALAFALKHAGKGAVPHPLLKYAGDDILFTAIRLPGTTPDTVLFQPLILDTYRGDQEHEIDQISDNWRRNLKIAIPDLSDGAEHDILLAARETVLNALKHGCGANSAKTARFQISCAPASRLLRIWVEDPGAGHNFDISAKARSIESHLANEHHGLLFIINLAKNVTFERNGATVILDFQL